MDDVAAYLKVMKVKQWKEKMKDREQWTLLRRTRLTQGCGAEREEGRKLIMDDKMGGEMQEKWHDRYS
jgi:hypothetical protein